jgi:hypothetical protein
MPCRLALVCLGLTPSGRAVQSHQFGYLYTFHPATCSKAEIATLVDEVMTRHKRDAEAVWEKAGMMTQAEIDAQEGRVGAGLGKEAVK